jgi:hypothetical protein
MHRSIYTSRYRKHAAMGDSGSDSDSDSAYDSDCEYVTARVLKRIKAMCSLPGCDHDIDCELHAKRNARIKLFQGVKECTSSNLKSFLVYPATPDMVNTIFDMEPDKISSVGMFGQYIIVGYYKTVNATARKRSIIKAIPAIEVTALGQTAVKMLTKNIVWDALQERDIAYPTEPSPPTNFINHIEVGRWYSTHVVPYVIDLILRNMKSNSKSRKGQHDFKYIEVLHKLRAMFETNTDGRCGCGRSECDVQLTLNGVKGISPDRKHDHLGYGHLEQILVLVCKWHNTSLKCETTPKTRSCRGSWLATTTNSIRNSYRRRMRILKKKKCKSAVESEQLRKFAHFEAMEAMIKQKTKTLANERLIEEYNGNIDHHSTVNIRRILTELRDSTTHCWKCLRTLVYGDDGDIDAMTLANVERRASPDRTENMLNYTGGNTKLVCTSCNFAENEYSRVNDDDVRSSKTPDYVLTDKLKALCIMYINALIIIGNTDDSRKTKRANRSEMRKRLFPKPPKRVRVMINNKCAFLHFFVVVALHRAKSTRFIISFMGQQAQQQPCPNGMSSPWMTVSSSSILTCLTASRTPNSSTHC